MKIQRPKISRLLRLFPGASIVPGKDVLVDGFKCFIRTKDRSSGSYFRFLANSEVERREIQFIFRAHGRFLFLFEDGFVVFKQIVHRRNVHARFMDLAEAKSQIEALCVFFNGQVRKHSVFIDFEN